FLQDFQTRALVNAVEQREGFSQDQTHIASDFLALVQCHHVTFEQSQKIKEYSGPIRHAVIMYLSERKAEDLVDPEGKNKLRADLLKRINTAIGTPLVLNVYFKEFLIQ
ncbi:MAG: flagellar basal body-associated FliL family protein, partial [Deltaproteobacteria bacterium]|nr:flagellar basal body-associated FliL family protein [Deltaproteobacteria bacterium]MDZ4345307.1 flagellar basal body-associated FliL family protein [Candidatus Binatia bacterium]